MSHDTESRILRLRDDESSALVDTLAREAPGSPVALLVKTVTVTTYPTVAGRFYGVQALWPDGAEIEGGTGTFNDDGTGTFYALNVGSAIPPAGTKLLIESEGGRWVFRYDG